MHRGGSAGQDNVFRVAIIGGGIGGLFCALSIHHHCTSANVQVRIDIYEQASQYKEIGAGVGLGVNAARLFHQLGIGNELNAIAGHRAGVWLSFRRFDNSDNIFTVPVKDSHTIRQAPCARTDVLDLLRKTVEERRAATLHTRKACRGLEDLGTSVRVCFQDGSYAVADLAIGCDGIHSAVRSQFAEDKPTYSGQIAYRAVVPIASLPDWPFETYSLLWVAKHRHWLVFPISGNRDLNIVAFVTKDARDVADVKESWTSLCDRAEVAKEFEHFDKPVQDIIALIPEQPSKWKLNDREPLSKWHYMSGKVVLLGDAAHAMLPHAGAGAGQATEDGWVLGRALGEYLSRSGGRHPVSLESTMQLYQDVRLPRAQKTQATSRLAGDTYELQTEDLRDKSFDECLPLLAKITEERMKWVWEEHVDDRYEKMRDEAPYYLQSDVGM